MSQQDWHLISSYAGILTLATFSVYAGSFGSLKVSGLSIFNVLPFIKKFTCQKIKQAPRSAKGKKDSGDDDSEQEDEEIPERVTTSEALLFPVVSLLENYRFVTTKMRVVSTYADFD